MRTYKRQTETKEVSVLDFMACDRCEKEIKLINKDVWGLSRESVNMKISAGYGSKHDFVSQENDWEFDICDDCCTEILKSFKKDVLTVDWSDDE